MRSQNGHEMDKPTDVARDPSFTFSDGTVVTLSTLGEAVLIGLMSEVGKPEPPERVVEMAGGGVKRVPRGSDEPLPAEAEIEAIDDPTKRKEAQAYRAWRLALAEWEQQRSLRFARTLFLLGVRDWPPIEAMELWRAIGWTDKHDIKYNWLAYLCREEGEWTRFIETVISLSMPDEEGIDEMQEIFRGTVAGQQPQALGTPGHVAKPPETEAAPAEDQAV